MPHRDWRVRIEDILDAIASINGYVRGMDYGSFADDRRTLDAVVYRFVVIGEASNHVPDDVRASNPDIPWERMRRMRNIGAHICFGIRPDIIWDTIRNDLPKLTPLLQGILNATGPDKDHL